MGEQTRVGKSRHTCRPERGLDTTIGSRRETCEISRKRMNLETVLDLAPASALAELPSLVRGRIKTLMPLSPAQPSALASPEPTDSTLKIAHPG